MFFQESPTRSLETRMASPGPEAIRSAEIRQASEHLLVARARKLTQERGGKPIETDEQDALAFVAELDNREDQDTLEPPERRGRTPEATEGTEVPVKPIYLYVRPNGDLTHKSSPAYERLQLLKVHGLHGERIRCAVRNAGGRRELVSVPRSALYEATLITYKDDLARGEGITASQRDLLTATADVLQEDSSPLRDDALQSRMPEAFRDSNMLTVDMVRGFGQNSLGLKDETLDKMLEGIKDKRLLTVNDVMASLDKMGMFSLSKLKRNISDITDQITSINERLSNNKVGDTIVVDGNDVKITDSIVAQWKDEITALTEQRDILEAQLETADGQDLPKQRQLLRKYLDEVMLGEMPVGQSKVLLTAFENGDWEGMAEVIFDRETEKEENESKKREIQEKKQQLKENVRKYSLAGAGVMLFILYNAINQMEVGK